MVAQVEQGCEVECLVRFLHFQKIEICLKHLTIDLNLLIYFIDMGVPVFVVDRFRRLGGHLREESRRGQVDGPLLDLELVLDGLFHLLLGFPKLPKNVESSFSFHLYSVFFYA